MKKELVIGLIVIVLILIALLIFLPKLGNKNECQSDSDCVIQQITCCGCNMGGQEACMSSENASYWKNELEKCDKNQLCMQVYNCREIKCSCANNKCSGE